MVCQQHLQWVMSWKTHIGHKIPKNHRNKYSVASFQSNSTNRITSPFPADLDSNDTKQTRTPFNKHWLLIPMFRSGLSGNVECRSHCTTLSGREWVIVHKSALRQSTLYVRRSERSGDRHASLWLSASPEWSRVSHTESKLGLRETCSCCDWQ